MKLRINPNNPTELWGTFDGREPIENDHDFGADFYYDPARERETAHAAADIVNMCNGVEAGAYRG